MAVLVDRCDDVGVVDGAPGEGGGEGETRGGCACAGAEGDCGDGPRGWGGAEDEFVGDVVRVADDKGGNVLGELESADLAGAIGRGEEGEHALDGAACRGAKAGEVKGVAIEVEQLIGIGAQGINDVVLAIGTGGHARCAIDVDPITVAVGRAASGRGNWRTRGADGTDGECGLEDRRPVSERADVPLAEFKDVADRGGGLEGDEARGGRLVDREEESGTGPGGGSASVIDEEIAKQRGAVAVLREVRARVQGRGPLTGVEGALDQGFGH